MHLLASIIIVAATMHSGVPGPLTDSIITPEPPVVVPQIETIDLQEAVEAAVAEPSPSTAPEARSAPSLAPSATVPPEFTAGSAEADVLTERLDADPFVAAGVTWDAGTAPPDLQVQVRVRERGTWTAWSSLGLNDNQPDAGTDEAEGSTREGTEPLLSIGADGVQVRVDSADGSTPEGLEVNLIDPGTSDHDQIVGAEATLAGHSTIITRPDVVTRAQWGADERMARDSTENDQVSALVLHHTAGSNTYSQAQAVQQLRGIYAYHTKSLGWSDIGYNLLVDRYGTVYEGRRGSITGMPRGAHTGGFNDRTYGVSVMGNFQEGSVPPVVVSRLAEVVAWKMWEFGIQAKDSVRLTSAGGGTSRYPAGTSVSVATLSAHRALGLTSCPGDNLVSLMAGIATDVEKRLAAAPPSPGVDTTFPKDWDGDDRADVVALDGLGRMMLYPGNGGTGFTTSRQIGRGWQSKDLVTLAGDWDGDRHPDILARDVNTGSLWLYRGNGTGGFISGEAIGGSWTSVDAIIGVSDWDSDGNVDVLARIRSTGALNLYLGDGRGGFLSTRQIGSGFTAMNEFVPTGSFRSDDKASFVARETSSGRLYLYEATAGGGLGGRTQIGNGWGGMHQIIGLGDFDRGGNDVIAKTSDNRLMLYRGNGAGGFEGSVQIGKGWGGLDVLD